MRSKTVMIVAGEASGDLHGAHLVEAVRQIHPGIQFCGMGGEALRRTGMSLLYHHQSLSVVGITEVILKLRSILKTLRGLKRAMDGRRPDLLILIDFPDFNLRLARFAHRRRIPVLYYISPQVWAWRSGRVEAIARRVKKMVVFFAFEAPIYKAAGVDVEWIGHPLLDVVKPMFSRREALQKFGLDPQKRTIGLLPGSRHREVERLLPVLLATADLLQKQVSDLQFILPLASGLPRSALSPWMKKTRVPVKVVEGFTYDVMNVSDLLIACSGTATLEAAILEKPMLIVYKLSSLSYWIGKMLVRVDHIGLVNLVAGKRIAPEFLQKEATPEKIAGEAARVLNDPDLLRAMAKSMIQVRRDLGEPGAVQRAARIVTSMLDNP